MILKELKMKNFKSHKDTTIKFHEGITIITGENGAGKTTIFEAIQYALFKKTNNVQKELMKHGARQMQVQLTFMENGNTYMIKRTRQHNSTESELHKINEKGEPELVTSSNRETDNTLQGIISMPHDMFLNAIYIKQGEITDLISKSSSERKKLITKLLDIDSLEKCWANMPKIIKKYENREENIKGMLTEEQENKNELQHKKKQLCEYNEKLNRKNEETEQIKAKITTLNEEKQQMEKEHQQHTLLKQELSTLTKEQSSTRKNCTRLQTEYEKKLKYEEELDTITKKLKEEDLNELIEKNEKFKNIKNLCLHKNNEIKEKLKTLEQTEGECPTCHTKITEKQKTTLIKDYEKTIKANEKLIIESNEEMKTLNDKINQHRTLKNRHSIIQEKANGKEDIGIEWDIAEKELMTINSTILDVKKNIKEKGYDPEKYDLKCKELDTLEKTKIDNIECIGILKGKISNTERRIKELEDKNAQYDELRHELEKISNYIETLKKCRETYSKDGLQAKIRDTVKPIIKATTESYFKMFNFDYDGLQLDEDYNVQVSKQDEPLTINMLSGGEQISIALALRLGITDTIAQGNIEYIMLDEPTNHLDTTRIQELCNLLENIKTIPQIFIVTHEEEMERIADNIFKVIKNDGASEVI